MPSSAVTVFPDSRHVYAKKGLGVANQLPGSREWHALGRGLAMVIMLLISARLMSAKYTDTSCTAAETGTQTPAIVRLISAKRILATWSLGACRPSPQTKKNAPRARICLVDS